MKAVIFDLDGVILSTDNYHYLAWKKMADEENIYFDRKINERLRGVSRIESLNIILEKSDKKYSNEEKIELTERKNKYYNKLLEHLTPKAIFIGVLDFIKYLKKKKYKVAIGSSSKNTKTILKKIDLENTFDVVVDGTLIKNSKPDPEIFIMAAQNMNVKPKDCYVIEDADAGIIAAKKAGMIAIGVGYAANCKEADYRAKDLQSIDLNIFN